MTLTNLENKGYWKCLFLGRIHFRYSDKMAPRPWSGPRQGSLLSTSWLSLLQIFLRPLIKYLFNEQEKNAKPLSITFVVLSSDVTVL